MKRDEWEFEYTASTLATAAVAQRDFRISRVAAQKQPKNLSRYVRHRTDETTLHLENFLCSS